MVMGGPAATIAGAPSTGNRRAASATGTPGHPGRGPWSRPRAAPGPRRPPCAPAGRVAARRQRRDHLGRRIEGKMHVSIDEPGQQTRSGPKSTTRPLPEVSAAVCPRRDLPSWMTTMAWPSVRSPSNTCPARSATSSLTGLENRCRRSGMTDHVRHRGCCVELRPGGWRP